METIDLASIVSFLNILLLLTLSFIYVRNYRTIKSKFCLGLMIFAFLFLIQNLIAFYFQVTMMYYYSKEVANIALVLNVLEALGFVALLYITWKPR